MYDVFNYDIWRTIGDVKVDKASAGQVAGP